MSSDADAHVPARPPDVPSPDLIARLDAGGRHRDANAAYGRWIGHAPDELAGRRHRDLGVAAPIADRWERAIAAAVGSPAPVTFELDDPTTGEPRRLEFRLWHEPDGATPAAGIVYAVGRDVTARHVAADASRADATRYRTLVEATSQAVWRTGPRGELMAENQPWMDYTAQYTDAATLSDLLWLAEVHPADRPRVEAAWWEAVRAGGPYEARYRLRRQDGTWQDVLAFGVPVRDADGRIAEWIGTVREYAHRAAADDDPSAARLAAVERLAGVGSWELDRETGRVSWSEEMRRIMAVPSDVLPSVQAFERHVDPHDLAHVRAHFRETLDGGSDTTPYEFRVLLPGGAERVVEGRARLLQDRDDRPRHVLGTVQDVTDRRRAERSVAESEARFRSLVEASAQIVWRLDADGTCVDEFGAIERFGGIVPGASPPHPDWWMELVRPDDRAHTSAALAGALASGTLFHVEHRVRRRDGEWRTMDARAVPVRDADGAIREWIGAHVDITEMARVRQALDDARRLRDALIDHIPDALWMKSPDGRYLVANAVFAGMVGRASADVVAATDAELFPPEVAARFVERDRAVLASGLPAEIEEHLVGPDGVVRTFETVKVVLRDGAGRAIGTVGAARDVSARRVLEEQLRHAQKLEALGLLAGSVAHDFNNLLTGIIGSAELARFEVPDDSTAAQDLDEVRRTAARAAGLTRQLLAFSRRQVPQPRALDVRELVQGSERLLRRLLPEPVLLDIAPADAPCVVRADPGHLEQVLLNLVVNARDAVEARLHAGVGGRTGTIEIEVAPSDAPDAPARAGLPAGRYVALRVRDDGVGIDAATRARLFEPFFTTKPLGAGTGLGLAVVFGIVSQAGGAVSVDSAPGAGATFTVLLPALEEPAERHGTDVPLLPGGTETILLVEDEAVVRETARRLLERHGYRVLAARHGGDALLAWRAHGPTIDLVVTDLRMPELDGHELVARLRAERPSLPVLLLSGYAGTTGAHVSAMLEREVFLAKPFTNEALLIHVRQALARAQPRGDRQP